MGRPLGSKNKSSAVSEDEAKHEIDWGDTDAAIAAVEADEAAQARLGRVRLDMTPTTVTVTKFGAGKISTGVHVAGEGDIMADRGEKMTIPKHIADDLEATGLVEAD